MNYPFISILPLVDEVSTELKTIVKSSQFGEEDMYGFAVEAARLIAHVSYESNPQYFLKVKKHTALLPKNLFLIEDIYLGQAAEGCVADIVRPGILVGNWNRTAVLFPADKQTLSMSRNRIGSRHREDHTYTIKIPPGVMRFSFAEGIVEMSFQQMVCGEDGGVLIQDEANTVRAIKDYIIVMLLKERYILGQVDRNRYKDMEANWENYRDNAQRNLKFPGHDEVRARKLQQDRRFSVFRYKNQ